MGKIGMQSIKMSKTALFNVTAIVQTSIKVGLPNQSLKLTEVAVDDLARAKHTATIGRGIPRADWIPSLRHFVAAA